MASHDATVGQCETRNTVVDESACVGSDAGQSNKKGRESPHGSQKGNKKKMTPTTTTTKTTGKRSSPKKHRRSKPKRDESSDSSSEPELDDVSSDSDSDSVDSASDSDIEVTKKKHPLRSSKGRQPARNEKRKCKSSRRRIQHSSGSESESSLSESNVSTEVVAGSGRSLDEGLDVKEPTRFYLHEQLNRLEVCVSQLQLQLAQTTGMTGMIAGLPNTLGLSAGTYNGRGNGNFPAQPSTAAANSLQPPERTSRPARAPRLDRTATRDRPSVKEVIVDRKSQVVDKKTASKKVKVDFKRVDWVWDSSLYTYKLQDTAQMSLNSMYDEYIFHVRRTFDCEGKLRATLVDIRSKLLRESLQEVIGNVRGASLVDETPKLDPNLLFLYLEDFRLHVKQLKTTKPTGEDKKDRKKMKTRIRDKRKHLKVLIAYLDEDYAKIKDSLYPMLDSGIITFDLLWALWKPNTLIYGTTYGSGEDPRVFKVDMAYHHSTIMRGNSYIVEGKYLEFDGKKFGYGTSAEDISEFQGARKITSLPCYPLKYHKDEARVRQKLIERGKKFVALSGVHYKCYSGVAYMKRKKGAIVKFNVQQSRIMVDPAIFRRMNPNYAVSMVRPKDDDDMPSDEGMSDESNCCDSDSLDERQAKMRYVSRLFNKAKLSQGETGEVGNGAVLESLPREGPSTINGGGADGEPTTATDKGEGPSESSTNGGETAETPTETPAETVPHFSDENYLIASPVVFGFAFSEKQWLELSVSAVKDISWNEKAWDSLVLEPETKDLIQALVQSRKYHAAQTIDDVIQGKGKGLVTVLHGPPGTGKTLTAEGISELLKCPLYMASAGELGTDSRYLEAELQKILDICHAWGAILLLDEADVFLEKRNMQDIHRNALVSVFLTQMEYFQGILFLTTNRVETFDEAFQSRIHIALRYDALDVKARKAIFNMFIQRIKALGKLELQPFTEEDVDELARQQLNGREIKNVMGSAQDLAVSRGETFSMRHIRKVLDVHAKFGRDLRGGPGYEEAMRSYF
ncbi:hypothetical protein CP532_4946 [Ophiocordyceps camponoti-leonardi (nom. inval.)]|nr:hypothetical protein CP532_4946 [Ophiocordyceps camponoti-leonardi (nom. inval.)]